MIQVMSLALGIGVKKNNNYRVLRFSSSSSQIAYFDVISHIYRLSYKYLYGVLYMDAYMKGCLYYPEHIGYIIRLNIWYSGIRYMVFYHPNLKISSPIKIYTKTKDEHKYCITFLAQQNCTSISLGCIRQIWYGLVSVWLGMVVWIRKRSIENFVFLQCFHLFSQSIIFTIIPIKNAYQPPWNIYR